MLSFQHHQDVLLKFAVTKDNYSHYIRLLVYVYQRQLFSKFSDWDIFSKLIRDVKDQIKQLFFKIYFF